MNLCLVPLGDNGSVTFGGVSIPLPLSFVGVPSDRVFVGLRPEAVEVASTGQAAMVEAVEKIGADAYVFCSADVAGETARLVARVEARRAPRRGERLVLRPRPDEAHLFDADSGDRIG